MLFNSFDFMFFFPIAVIGFYIVPKKVRYVWLLLCSYYFYMSWNPKYAILIFISTVVTYFGSIIIGYISEQETNKKIKKIILGLIIVINLGILVYFKYSNFFLICIAKALESLGISLVVPAFDVILPVGISFYTFQALSYSIDVYKAEVKPERNFLKYALFISFFPQLIAGPIERSKNLLRQIQDIENRKLEINKVYHGLLLMLWGLFLKMVIADRVVVFVDKVFDGYYHLGGVELMAGAMAFAIQIYCDFSSYSTIAIGVAETIGFQLIDNFDTPYLSCNIKEFWRRWHISLSMWFRDYLYIPLGGNRCSKSRKYINIIITFLVSGLWHGASMNYVVWGFIHGVYQVAAEIIAPAKSRINRALHINKNTFSYKLGQIIGTFLLTDFAWIFFRCSSLKDAFMYVKRIFLYFNPWILSQGGIYELGIDRANMNVLVLAVLLLFLSDLIRYTRKCTVVDFVLKQNVLFQYICILFIVIFVFVFGAYGPIFDKNNFIYFQF